MAALREKRLKKIADIGQYNFLIYDAKYRSDEIIVERDAKKIVGFIIEKCLTIPELFVWIINIPKSFTKVLLKRIETLVFDKPINVRFESNQLYVTTVTNFDIRWKKNMIKYTGEPTDKIVPSFCFVNENKRKDLCMIFIIVKQSNYIEFVASILDHYKKSYTNFIFVGYFGKGLADTMDKLQANLDKNDFIGSHYSGSSVNNEKLDKFDVGGVYLSIDGKDTNCVSFVKPFEDFDKSDRKTLPLMFSIGNTTLKTNKRRRIERQ